MDTAHTTTVTIRPKRILAPKEAYARASLSRVTAWKLEKLGQFPAAVWITKGRKGYIESEMDDWISARIAERDGAPV